ncbi:hypothetical protein [Paraburkholderia sediminicola]|uniref:hypothetical protein n=1 Tax=Paraburkholderia sediminicola TaxID=458836 RepID=UPI0038B79FA2
MLTNAFAGCLSILLQMVRQTDRSKRLVSTKAGATNAVHSSDYASTDAAKAAIDRYFAERNQHLGTSETRGQSNLAKGADDE